MTLAPAGNQPRAEEPNEAWAVLGTLVAGLGIYVTLLLALVTGAMQVADYYAQHIGGCSAPLLEVAYRVFVVGVVVSGAAGGTYLAGLSYNFKRTWYHWAREGYPRDGFTNDYGASVSRQVPAAVFTAACAFMPLFVSASSVLVIVPILVC